MSELPSIEVLSEMLKLLAKHRKNMAIGHLDGKLGESYEKTEIFVLKCIRERICRAPHTTIVETPQPAKGKEKERPKKTFETKETFELDTCDEEENCFIYKSQEHVLTGPFAVRTKTGVLRLFDSLDLPVLTTFESFLAQYPDVKTHIKHYTTEEYNRLKFVGM